MTEDAAREAYLDAASAMLGLPLRAEHRAAAQAAFAVLRAQGELVTEFTLPPEAEAAPRFRP